MSLAVTHWVFFGGELPQFPCNISMIPPCDPSILEQNPQFKRLYENLTTSLLNPDASTRAHSANPGRIAVVEVSRRSAIAQHIPNGPRHEQSSDNTLSLGAERMPDSKSQKANQRAHAPAIGLCPRQQSTSGGQYNPCRSPASHQENRISNDPTTSSATITSL
jgi:hypothetical protein